MKDYLYRCTSEGNTNESKDDNINRIEAKQYKQRVSELSKFTNCAIIPHCKNEKDKKNKIENNTLWLQFKQNYYKNLYEMF